MTRVFEHMGPPPAIAEAQPSNSCLERVKAAFQAVLDCLILVAYAIQYAFYQLTHLKFDREWIFTDEVITKTHNFPKFSELWAYIQARHSPEPLPEQVSRIASEFGFVNTRTHISPRFSSGFCFGGVTVFCQKWLETQGDINAVAEEFKGGIPLKGAIYQEAYETLFEEKFYPELSTIIQNARENRRDAVSLPAVFANAGPLIEGAQSVEGNAEAVHQWALEERNIHIGGRYYATLREALPNSDSSLARTKAAFKLAGLNAQVLHSRSMPGPILGNIETLEPGAYTISFPTYGIFGEKSGDLHTVAFVFQEGAPSYFCENNRCIASVPKEEVKATIERLFTHYTGLDYTQDPNGQLPSFFRRAANFFQERANPPPTSIDSTFELLKINLIQN